MSKQEMIWHILSNNSFPIDSDVPTDLICVICLKLCVDPYSGLCGCQFCLECIKSYLSQGRSYCPGTKDECRSEFLIMNRNIIKDLKTTHKLMKLVVKCPNQMCDFKTKLESLQKHMSKCSFKPVQSCARYSEVIRDDQSKLISEVNDLKNDFEELRKSLDSKDIEIKRLTEDFNEKEKAINDLELKMGYLMERIDNLQQTSLIKETEINDIKDDFNKREKTLLRNVSMFQSDSNVFDFQDHSSDEWTHLRAFREKIKSDNEEISKSVSSISEIVKELHVNGQREFFWSIHNFTENRKAAVKLRSRPFYKNSYKMHLFLGFHDDELRIWCHILKGEFDAYIDWPMKKRVILSVFNQETMQISMGYGFQYDSYKNKSAFGRPQRERNEGFGTDRFIKISDLINTKGLLCDDTLLVSCTVDD